MKKYFIIILFVLIFASIASIFFHYYHLPQKRTAAFLASNPLRLDKKGYSVTCPLDLKYHDVFELGFFCDGCQFPANYKFHGALSLEYFWDHKLQYKEVITKTIDDPSYESEFKHSAKRILKNLDMRMKVKGMEDLKIRLTIIKVDDALKNTAKRVKFYLAVHRLK